MFVRLVRNILNPVRIQFRFLIYFQKVLALDFAGERITQQFAFKPHQTLVQPVQLFDQLFNAGSVQMNGTHQFNQFFFNLQIFFLNACADGLAGQNSLNALILNFL